MTNFTRDETKQIVKEAITEWLDKKYEAFGKYTFRGFVVAGFSALIVLIGNWNGWRFF
jgi:hypothetical protein